MRFNFTGTATYQYGIFRGQPATVTGSYTYDTVLTDLFSGNPTLDYFASNQPIGNPSLSWDITVNNGAVTRSSPDNARPPTSAHHVLQFRDEPDVDQFIIEATGRILGNDYFRIFLRDFAPSPPNGIAPGTGNLTDAPLTSAIDPSLFSNLNSGRVYAYNDRGNILVGRLDFELTTVTPAHTEPVSIAVWCVLLISGAVAVVYLKNRAVQPSRIEIDALMPPRARASGLCLPPGMAVIPTKF